MASKASSPVTVKLTANFVHKLEEIEQLLIDENAAPAYDVLIDDLLETVVSNLERFPAMGQSFIDRPLRSVETSNGIDMLRDKLGKIDRNSEIREYVLQDYLLLYTLTGTEILLLAIRHHKQLSFDFKALW